MYNNFSNNIKISFGESLYNFKVEYKNDDNKISSGNIIFEYSKHPEYGQLALVIESKIFKGYTFSFYKDVIEDEVLGTYDQWTAVLIEKDDGASGLYGLEFDDNNNQVFSITCPNDMSITFSFCAYNYALDIFFARECWHQDYFLVDEECEGVGIIDLYGIKSYVCFEVEDYTRDDDIGIDTQSGVMIFRNELYGEDIAFMCNYEFDRINNLLHIYNDYLDEYPAIIEYNSQIWELSTDNEIFQWQEYNSEVKGSAYNIATQLLDNFIME